MTSEQTIKQPERSKLSVTSDDFVRFLEAKNPESDCPVCGEETWTVICPFDHEDAHDTYRLVTRLKDGSRPMTVSSFGLFCDSCGYLRQHVAKVVRQWVDDNPIEPELEFEPSPTDEDQNAS